MASREREDDYKFLQIVDAMISINQRVNLIGVVVETSIPKRTKGTDCFCTIKVIDESRPSPGISVNIFAENMEKLPHVDSAGDIIQLSYVVMKTHGSEIYAVFNKKFSSFALFEGKHSTDFIPYQVSSKFHARQQDKKFIVGLRRWLVDHRLDIDMVPYIWWEFGVSVCASARLVYACKLAHVGHLSSFIVEIKKFGSNNDLSLKEIREGERFNLIVKVLHISEVIKDEWMLFVWDGTDAPPLPIETKLEDETENPLPLQLEPCPMSRDILCTFPAVGTVLRVIVDQGDEKLGLHLVKAGRWVKLINIKCEVRDGLWRGVLMPFTKLRYLPDGDDLIIHCQRIYDERVASKWRRMPLLSFPWPSYITETGYPDVPFVTLMNVLNYTEVPATFRCVVRVVAAFPWQAKDFRSPLGTYRIRLTLEDPTGRIHAFVYAEDGVNFFGGCPSVDALTRKRNILLGIAESDDGQENKDHPRNPPWVQCCLKSYYLNKGDIWGSRSYRIFATKLMG